MRLVSSVVLAAIIVLLSLSCGKDSHSPTRPEDQGFAVSLQYQNYYNHMGYNWGCIRLTLDDNNIDRCGLGIQSSSLWTREYNWTLYVIDTRQEVDTYIRVQSGTIQVDRNITCYVNGNNVTWH